MSDNNTRTYLGDSVYVELADGMVKLFTHNGGSEVDTIFLEPDVLKALVQWMMRHGMVF